jgi:hypothetical protein
LILCCFCPTAISARTQHQLHQVMAVCVRACACVCVRACVCGRACAGVANAGMTAQPAVSPVWHVCNDYILICPPLPSACIALARTHTRKYAILSIQQRGCTTIFGSERGKLFLCEILSQSPVSIQPTQHEFFCRCSLSRASALSPPSPPPPLRAFAHARTHGLG